MSTICQDLNILGGGMFYNNWEYCGVVSDCEELVGVTLTGDDGVGFFEFFRVSFTNESTSSP